MVFQVADRYQYHTLLLQMKNINRHWQLIMIVNDTKLSTFYAGASNSLYSIINSDDIMYIRLLICLPLNHESTTP